MPRSNLPTFDEAARTIAERLVWIVVGAALGAAVYALVAWGILGTVPLTRWLWGAAVAGALLGAITGATVWRFFWELLTGWW